MQPPRDTSDLKEQLAKLREERLARKAKGEAEPSL
jgi:hypothetical protein